jgi:macrodomain Ter protein organizer (MatP/YcbG family)
MGRKRTENLEADRWIKRVKIALEPDVYRRLCNLANREWSNLSETGARLIELGMEWQRQIDRAAADG